MNSNIVFCPHCGEELRYDGFNEQDGHSHYYCMGCDIEFTENEVTLLNFDPTDIDGFGFEEDENEEEFVPKPFMVIDTDEYGEVTLMPSKDGSREYDIYDEDGNYLGEVSYTDYEDNMDDEDCLVALIESIIETTI